MRLKRIILKNIRSYEQQEISFPDGSVLLSGDIGSGKTSILLAIEYALFGLQPGQKGSALLRNDSDSGEVTLEMEVDGEEIIIERKLKRSYKSISNEYAAITIAGEKYEMAVSELKNRILQILGYPSEFIKKNNLLYRYTVYTPQEQMKQIILEDADTRITVLRHVFGIDKYKRIRDNISVLNAYLKEETKVLAVEIKNLDEEREKLRSVVLSLDDLNSKIKINENEVTLKISARKLLEYEVKELEEKIKERENFEKEVEKTKILFKSKRENVIQLQKEVEELEKVLSENQMAFSEEEYSLLLEKIELSSKSVESLNLKYVNILSQLNILAQKQKDDESKKDRVFRITVCPTCLQSVSPSHKHNILNETEKEITEIKKMNEVLEQERKSFLSRISEEKEKRSVLEKQKTALEIAKSKEDYLERSRKRLEDLRKNKSSLETDLELLSKHIDSLKEDILEFSKFSNLYKLKQEELKQAFAEEKHSEIALAQLTKELELTRKTISEVEESIKKKEFIQEKSRRISELNDWLSNSFLGLIGYIERNVMLKLRGEFSKLFNKWFHILAGDTFEVQLDETFTPLILQGDIEMEYSFLSGGERTAIALAYRLALNQTVNSMMSQIKTRDILILDEPTEGFSEIQLDKMRDVLAELDLKQLIIVSHEQKIEGFVDHIIRLKKEADISYIGAEVS